MLPAEPCELGEVFPVSFLVVRQLRRPIIGVRLRFSALKASSVLVPKAAVHEDDFSQGWKDKIGASG